jgi:hypothetical protein
MDGVMVIFTHRDVPGLIGFIGTIFGKHQVNIAQMTVGRQQPGGEAIAVLNLDSEPPAEAIREVQAHPQISSLSVVKLPPACRSRSRPGASSLSLIRTRGMRFLTGGPDLVNLDEAILRPDGKEHHQRVHGKQPVCAEFPSDLFGSVSV